MYIICYTNTNGESAYAEFTSSDIDAFKTEQSDVRQVTHVFRKANDIRSTQSQRRIDFNIYCINYDIDPGDYLRHGITPDGDLMTITGYLADNRKYKFQIYNHENGKTYKVTAQYIKNSLQRYDDLHGNPAWCKTCPA